MDNFFAYVLIQTTADQTMNVRSAVEKITGVVRVDVVTGPYDVIVLFEGESPQKIGLTILAELRRIPGIVDTLTCMAVV